MATFYYQFGKLPQQKSETGGMLFYGFLSMCTYIYRNCNTVSVELWDTSNEGADININRLLRSLVIPDEEMVPVLPKVRNCGKTPVNFKILHCAQLATAQRGEQLWHTYE